MVAKRLRIPKAHRYFDSFATVLGLIEVGRMYPQIAVKVPVLLLDVGNR